MPVRYSHRAMNNDIIKLATAVADRLAGRRLARVESLSAEEIRGAATCRALENLIEALSA